MLLRFSNIFRNFHTTSKNDAQLHKTFRKFLSPQKKKKMQFLDESFLKARNTETNFHKVNTNKQVNTRRANVLNKLFIRNITDLMVNGPNSMEYSKLNIVINRVKISSDFNFLNLLWISNDSYSEEPDPKALEEIAIQLRHELTQLRLMGSVPRINFVKDKRAFEIKELDKRLSIADFGTDYEKSEDILQSDVDPSDIENYDLLHDETKLPVMTHDIFGLNHKDILGRLTTGLKKSEQNTITPSIGYDKIKNHDPSLVSNVSERDAFRQFLLKRQISKSKQIKLQKKYAPDIELVEEETYVNDLEQQNYSNFDELDFIDEENVKE